MSDPVTQPSSGARTFVTSDEHYEHANIIALARRPFKDTRHMAETLIARHNAVVGPEDTTFHLGDYGLGDRARSLSYLSRLNGTHILVCGNHDKCFAGNRNAWKYRREYLDAGFAAVLDYATIKLPGAHRAAPGREVVLSHFPYTGDHHDKVRFTQYRLRDEGRWLIHGHVHGLYTVRDRGVNVGVDVWDYTPVEVATVARLIDDVEAGRVQPF